MKTVTGACDICKREFTNNNPQDLARAIGTHKRLDHNQLPTGKYLEKDKALVRYYQKLGKEPKSERAKQAYRNVSASWGKPDAALAKSDHVRKLDKRRKWDLAYRARKAMKKNGQVATQFMPAMHDRCPKCGARFYYVADQQ
jgi:hypothetical protein